jgi:hypothetical protein
MAEDYSRRSYGRRDQPYRGGGATSVSQERASNHKPESDPLAELARLVGQNDPFGEYGRATEDFRRAPSPREPEPSYRASVPRTSSPENHFFRASSQWAPSREGPLGASTNHRASERQMPNSGRVGLGNHDAYRGDEREAASEYSVRTQGQGHSARSGLVPYEDDTNDANSGPYNTEEEDFYEGGERQRRPIGRWVLSGILGLAVLGTAGAFAYHSFGFSHITGQPPIIKANLSPTKIVPASAAQPKSGINRLDELTEEKKGPEKIVSREEKPVAVNNESTVAVDQASNRPAISPSNIDVSQPKRIRTIAIRPDGTVLASAASDESISPVASDEPANTARASTPALEPSSGETPEQKEDQTSNRKNSPGRVTPNGTQRTNAPLSLSPVTGARPAVAPVRVASAGVEPSANIGGYGVQVSSQRSEDEARTALRNLQAKYPTQLGAKKFVIRKVDLGSKGIYYRALIGPFDTASNANELCGSLKAAGGQCIVQKN